MSKKKFTEIAEEPTYEELMKSQPNWVVWSSVDKRPRAPWVGHLNPCRWNGELDDDERPERPFEFALNWARHPGTRDLPHDGELGELGVAYLLPFESETRMLMVDLDNVRRSDTGKIHPVALEVITRLNSYAEVSSSGEGIHVFVQARIPEWYPGKTFNAELADKPWIENEFPKIEMYDSARVCLTTGRHLTATPRKATQNQGIVEDLIRDYDQSVDTVDDICDFEEQQTQISYKSDEAGYRSPYFEQSTVEVLQRSGAKLKKEGTGHRCAHPAHGSRNGNNLAAEGEVWYCHRHNAGGNALMLVAVLEGILPCERAGTNALSKLDEVQFARLCLTARDKYGFDGKPPSRAVRGTAIAYGLVKDSKSRIRHVYAVAQKFYDASGADELGRRVPIVTDGGEQ